MDSSESGFRGTLGVHRLDDPGSGRGVFDSAHPLVVNSKLQTLHSPHDKKEDGDFEDFGVMMIWGWTDIQAANQL
jgi:hypothetical protein